MNVILDELFFGIPDGTHFAHAIIRLIAAVILGAFIGIERERKGKSAGLRTHILITVGTTLFVLAAASSGMNSDGLSRVVQGLTTGIGFLGGGAILKIASERDIQGLTTATGIWVTAAIGVTIGLGSLGLAMLATLITVTVLTAFNKIDFKKQSAVIDAETKV